MVSSSDDVHTPPTAKGPPMRIVVEGEESTGDQQSSSTSDQKQPPSTGDQQQTQSTVDEQHAQADADEEETEAGDHAGAPPSKKRKLEGHRKEVPVEIVGKLHSCRDYDAVACQL